MGGWVGGWVGRLAAEWWVVRGSAWWAVRWADGWSGGSGQCDIVGMEHCEAQ